MIRGLVDQDLVSDPSVLDFFKWHILHNKWHLSNSTTIFSQEYDQILAKLNFLLL
jgi:hypothetical protein